ncbi:MAG: Acetylglutamate kinase [Candidatus Kaiserbacteria bacterium GW2011_GWA2_49_19]|uniref:Acetylglutamate kinase n=1 Tax=Candidatus Kaiserbacteria bacterium GW2011_GWA2_49_19 TaxID=1618669 RepID=A0A0G1YQ35_9BACT|nr:MAG: Acetylglutamate kinase [Candidatus Kaiserbacteria bacterium GW2011_GWA2_49_19]
MPADKKIIHKADVLIEALPYIQSFYGKTIVIKYGGAAMVDKNIRRDVLRDIVFMNYVGMRPILVHGGGPMATTRLKELGREVKFINGYRVTDKETMSVIEEEFMKINAEIVQELTALGSAAISLSGKEDRFIQVVKHAPIDGQDIGFVGDIKNINGDVLQKIIASDIIPVIPPIGIGIKDDQPYNINADQVAAEIAKSLRALKLVVLTNVNGILTDIKDPSTLRMHVNAEDVKQMIDSGAISGGMIPKVNACLHALDRGVKKAHIIDVQIPHGILMEIFTDKGIGTEIVKK